MTTIAPSHIPHVPRVLRGEKIEDLSFVEYPPSEWSWNIALALTTAILESQTKKYWTTNPEMGLYEISAHLGETWVARSTVNFKEHPEIFPHACALMETLLMRSKGALERLYGPDGARVAHFVAQGMHRHGQQIDPKWMTYYYDMRQSIETDEALQSHINKHVRDYPSNWSGDKERHYRINDSSAHWPLFSGHAPKETTVDWFNPKSYRIESRKAVINTDRIDAEPIAEINRRPYEGLALYKDGRVQLENHLGQNYCLTYEMTMEFSVNPVAGVRPLHLNLVIKSSSNIADEASLLQTHAWLLAAHLKSSISFWLNAPLVKNKIREAPFQPSMSIECELRDPAANTICLDSLESQLKEFLIKHMSGA